MGYYNDMKAQLSTSEFREILSFWRQVLLCCYSEQNAAVNIFKLLNPLFLYDIIRGHATVVVYRHPFGIFMEASRVYKVVC